MLPMEFVDLVHFLLSTKDSDLPVIFSVQFNKSLGRVNRILPRVINDGATFQSHCPGPMDALTALAGVVHTEVRFAVAHVTPPAGKTRLVNNSELRCY